MVQLMEIDRFGTPSSDSLVIKETLNGSSSNSPAPIYLSEGTTDQFQPVVFLDAEASPEEEELERTWNLGGMKSLDPLNIEYSFDQIKPNVVGPGFANLGNTCFLNAVLQCFTHTVPLIQGLQSVDHVKPCESYNEGFCLMCTLLYHIDDAVAAVGRVVSPWKLVKNLSYISSDFDRFQQEDAHEFLQCFLARLESCVPSTDGFLDEKSIVKQVFGGSLVSRIQCCECGHCSDTFEPMIDLSIEIGNVDSLLNALESFTDVEMIEVADTRFTCESCKEVVSIEKQLELENSPSIAAFHLKRFKNDGSYVDKIDKHVKFPLELDLSPYTRNSDMELKYYLYAIVVHEGTAFGCGHYYSCVRFSPDEWYKMDDSRVTRVKEEVVLSEEAYILFYAKMGTPWFSSFIKSEKKPKNTTNTSPKSVLESADQVSGIPRFDNIEVPEVKADDIRKVDVTFSFGTSNFGGIGRTTPNKNETVPSSPSVLKENSFKLNCSEFETILKEKDKLSTPVRPCSPDIYTEEQPAVRKIASSSKRQSEQNQEDDSSRRKQARRLVKSMPSQRGKRLLECLNNCSKKSPQGRVSTTFLLR
ncbi:ubiquitin carboxyl-terminal hydrolase 20-like [Impatiens glandulifera]|uniref:ubiquitin carboxyl-terminal hydrolase 20-like n=1 Tax=Impatiens glandulifera TaxID=253017 RepID=UPI001FB1085E|nr:ubiquitin carboxyl-terminal hydrolase 20-like [Impatiens glandulifera]